MNIYTTFWNVYRKISTYSNIRKDEAEFIRLSLLKLQRINIPVPKYLYDLGCGDGRISGFLGQIINFDNIFLIDNSDSVFLAQKRLQSSGVNSTAIIEDLDYSLKAINKNSLIIAIGVINFFPNQLEILGKIIDSQPKIVFLGVTGFSIRGSIYKGLNFLRESKRISNWVRSVLCYIDKGIDFMDKKASLKQRILLLSMKIIEPLVASRIYSLKADEYRSFFISKGYSIVTEKELGLCRWFFLVKA